MEFSSPFCKLEKKQEETFPEFNQEEITRTPFNSKYKELERIPVLVGPLEQKSDMLDKVLLPSKKEENDSASSKLKKLKFKFFKSSSETNFNKNRKCNEESEDEQGEFDLQKQINALEIVKGDDKESQKERKRWWGRWADCIINKNFFFISYL